MKQKILKSFADLRFAIILLLLIALFSIIGTIIEQDQSIETYKINYPLSEKIFGFLSWDVIIKFGFDHVYKTWWFITLILIFGLSLLLCTTLQQVPSLKISRSCQFLRKTQQFQKLTVSSKLNNSSLQEFLFRIKKINYSIFQQKNILYCYKGLIGRFSPIIVHFSMILILIGAIFSSLNGFKAQEIIPKTEFFHIQNILNNGKISLIPKLSGRINDFWITYTNQNTIDQFYSDFSILNGNGNEIKRQTIFVNSPAQYNGINYYQTDWNLIGLRIQDLNSRIVQYPLITILKSSNKFWLSWIPMDNTLKKGIIILINNLEGFCSVYNNYGKFIGNLELNEIFSPTFPIVLIDIISSTGLQIKLDPGIPLIYTGFLFLIISTIISYITYSQLWIVQEKNKIIIGGNTNRGTFGFELEFFKLINSNIG